MAADAQVPEPRGWFNLRQRLETKDVDLQLSSPLYARIPPEIRDLIFELAVTEFASPKARTIKSDAFVQESHDLMPIPESAGPSTVEESISERFRNQIQGIVRPRHHMRPYTREHSREPRDGFDWLRFDNTEPMKVGTTLLLTCRRAYLEAHSLPLLRTEQRFYCHRGPYSGNSEGSRVDIGKFITNRLSNPAPVPGLYQKDLVRSVRLFTQQFWLEDTFLQFVNTSVWFANLEHLRITLRRSDWWDWERNAVPRVNPFRGNCYHGHTVGLMHQDMEAETGNVEFREGAWGKAFSHMLKLKTLTIDFETSEDKRDDMETIVTWALRWRFPLANGRHLSTGGQTASKMSWRGLPHHWSDKCVSCDKFVRNSPPGQDCPKCKETRQLFSQRYGPQLLVWTCLWTPV